MDDVGIFLRKYKYIPLIIGLVLLVFLLYNFQDITAQEIVDYSPDDYLLAFFMMMALFAIKSLSVFIPLPVLYLSSTLIFTSHLAIVVNLLGLILSLSLPYLIGVYSASEFLEKIFFKYPRVKKINDFKRDNEFGFTFTIKLVGLIPNDISSLLLGSMNVGYFKFLTASILVRLPMMLFTTITGLNYLKDEKNSLMLIGIVMLISLVILYLSYGSYKHKYK